VADQQIRFTAVGGRSVAWSAVGVGPVLVVGGWWCSHLELDWEDSAFRRFVERLGTRFRVVRYDRPGTGLSDRDGPAPTNLDDEVAVLDAVVRATGEEAVLVLGASSGGCVAARYAASHPRRVRRLVLYGSYANGNDIASETARASLQTVVAAHWGLGSRVLADVFLPSAGAEERNAFARLQRLSSSAENAAASLAAVYAMDVRDDLPALTVPTLVLHRRADHAIPASLGRDVAARVPDSVFVSLDGVDHFPWRGDARSVVDAVIGFLGEPAVPTPVAIGRPALPPELAALAVLSERELAVLGLVAAGLGDGDIAERLVISPHTVHRHVANIRTKLGLPSRAAAAAAAVRAGLI
jgi:pimeloyl-ACP methyl ester carboxylesterase/DNA-binding CsgD family transcriptional regulator